MSKHIPRKPLIGFAEQVVECEIELRQTTEDLSMLKKLISLLVVSAKQEGIEYYQSVNDPKYLYYKEKLDTILINNQHLLKQSRYKSPEVQADDTIRDYEQKNNDFSRKIHSNLSVQNGCLSERLSIRRKTITVGHSNSISGPFNDDFRKIAEEKKVRIKKVVNKYKAMLSKDNFIITIEQMNKEVEEVEREFKTLKFN